MRCRCSYPQRFAKTVQRDHASVLEGEQDVSELAVSDGYAAPGSSHEESSASGLEEEEEEDGEEDASAEEDESEEKEKDKEKEKEREGSRLNLLGALELEGMILTAPSVAPEPDQVHELTPPLRPAASRFLSLWVSLHRYVAL
eukprot:2443495-Rhodomonas_salina.1